MNNRETNILFKVLPPIFIKRGFIKNDTHNTCNYEDYLIELLNESPYFMSRTNNCRFHHSKSESNKENDAVSGQFDLDFKLVMSSSGIEAEVAYNNRFLRDNNGVVIEYVQDPPQERTLVTWLLGDLGRVRSSEQINQILSSQASTIPMKRRNSTNIEAHRQGELKIFIDNLLKEKHLFFFIPCIAFFENTNLSTQEETIILGNELSYIFESFFKYRNVERPQFETFVSCVFKNALTIFRWDGDHLSFVDKIDLSKSQVFEELKEFDPFFSWL